MSVRKATSLNQRCEKAHKRRQENGGSWGSGRVNHNQLAAMDYANGGSQTADFGTIRVLIDAALQIDDPRTAWATLEENLPCDLAAEYAAASAADLRHFTSCSECRNNNPCTNGLELTAIRRMWIDAIALRNRGYGLLHAPTIQMPGSAYSNSR